MRESTCKPHVLDPRFRGDDALSTVSHYTHFKGNHLSRVERIEREVVRVILRNPLSDAKREWSVAFEMKHSSSVTQIGRILAQKRGLRDDLAAVICALHDISVFTLGHSKDHAANGARIAEKMLRRTKQWSAKDIAMVARAIHHHSDKHIVSSDPYIELAKDADVFDCSLLIGMHDAYVEIKSPEMCRTYFDRINAIRKELGLPRDPQWETVEFLNEKPSASVSLRGTK